MNWKTDDEGVTSMTSWFLAYAIGEKMESHPKIENSKEYQISRVGMRVGGENFTFLWSWKHCIWRVSKISEYTCGLLSTEIWVGSRTTDW